MEDGGAATSNYAAASYLQTEKSILERALETTMVALIAFPHPLFSGGKALWLQ